MTSRRRGGGGREVLMFNLQWSVYSEISSTEFNRIYPQVSLYRIVPLGCHPVHAFPGVSPTEHTRTYFRGDLQRLAL